jgi:hypothetical protein
MFSRIESHLNSLDLDIRKSNGERFMDQKVTPDVLCIIADCVVNLLENIQDKNREFTGKDIWNSVYFNDTVKEIFSKPDVHESTAKSEYDKFIQQPLNMLAYAKILSKRKARANYYRLINEDLLEYISLKERNSYNFLYLYICKTLKDSNLLVEFQKFKENNTQEELVRLKNTFLDYILKYTRIKQKTEASRIFTKVLNPYAAKNNIYGTVSGHISKNVITYSDLLYNRINFRDRSKEKGVTRKLYGDVRENREVLNRYQIEKAKKIIKRIHKSSEVIDNFAIGEATQVHHIFPQSTFPTIAAHLENLILLTPQQHFTKAHPNNNTKITSKDYQLICLIAKSNTIETYLTRNNENSYIYTKEGYIYVVNTGLKQKFENKISFKALREQIIRLYNGVS